MNASRKVTIEEVDDDGDLTFENLVNDVDFSMGGERSERARAENQVLLEELERKKRARSMAVPTDDNLVKARLRETGEPITLFGERAPDRRDRLKYVMSQIATARGGEAPDFKSESESSEEEEEEFYTPGSLELLDARRKIAAFSLPRAQKRIEQQREQSRVPLKRIIDLRKRVFTELKTFSILGSQIGEERPISLVRFAPDGRTLATGSWSGSVKIWDIPSCNIRRTHLGHSDRVGGIAWHPQATLSQGPDLVNLVSGGGDNQIRLWNLSSTQSLSVLTGHSARVCRVAFHPSGGFIGSASFDGTWRLWDVNTSQELLLQEGHSMEVYTLAFQDDGALVASGGLDAIGRVWDLRTGRTAMVLDGHAQGIYGMDFSPNGYQIATGSSDDTVRIWDMRSLRALHTIPAHKSNISDIKYFRRAHQASDDTKIEEKDVMMEDEQEDVKPSLSNDSTPKPPPPPPVHLGDNKYQSGLYLITSGYDGLVKIWSADDWQLVKALATDAGRVMSADISSDGMFIASGSWNRSYQLFAGESVVM